MGKASIHFSVTTPITLAKATMDNKNKNNPKNKKLTAE
jgi:hypothetical protein